MTTKRNDTDFSDSISQVYQDYMVPLIFEPYAVDLATRISLQAPKSILEIAAGTGAATREIASRLQPDAHLTVTDLNQPMLDIAKQNIQDKRINWQQCNALSLPFDDQTFDAVVCQFGAMFFPDHICAYKEAHRVLKPNGRFYFNVWDKISENCFTEEIENALEKYFPNDPPKFMSRTPHGYFDKEKIRTQLVTAGFSEIEIETVTYSSKAPSPEFVATAFCKGTILRSEIESRSPNSLEKVAVYLTEALTKRYGNGEIEDKIQAFVINAKKSDIPLK